MSIDSGTMKTLYACDGICNDNPYIIQLICLRSFS